MTSYARKVFYVGPEPAEDYLLGQYYPDSAADSELSSAIFIEPGTKFVGPFFSFPFDNGAMRVTLIDATVHNRLLELFDGLTTDTVVRGAIYNWNQTPIDAEPGSPETGDPEGFTDVVADRIAGGTDAVFIVDKAAEGEESTSPTVVDRLPSSNLVVVDRGNGIQHAKYFIFSHLEFEAGQAPHFPRVMDFVVAVTTANITGAQYRSTNNLVVMHGNEALYKEFLAFWEKQRVDAWKEITEDFGEVKLYTFPRAQPDVDENPFEWFLETLVDFIVGAGEAIGLDIPPEAAAVVLHAALPGSIGLEAASELWEAFINDTSYDVVAQIFANVLDAAWQGRGLARLRIAHSYWGRQAPITGLLALKGLGADIEVLISGNWGGPSEMRIAFVGAAIAAQQLTAAGIPVRVLPTSGVTVDKGADMHNKYILVDGPYESASRRRLVWTGSHNLNPSSLDADDEVVVRIENGAVYEKYLENFERLWRDAAPWNAFLESMEVAGFVAQDVQGLSEELRADLIKWLDS